MEDTVKVLVFAEAFGLDAPMSFTHVTDIWVLDDLLRIEYLPKAESETSVSVSIPMSRVGMVVTGVEEDLEEWL